MINFNLASEYYPDLGFWVSVDGAQRITMQLPAAALCSISPPGAFYQDNPIVEDVKVTLEYDLESMLSGPKWMDGYQSFSAMPYEPAMCIIIDIRYVVPSSSTTAPIGWACLPIFEPEGAYVASGYYHLPLIQGLPSRAVMAEMARSGAPERVVAEYLRSGKLKFTMDQASVYVRLVDTSRQGQLDAHCGTVDPSAFKVPKYAYDTGIAANMGKPIKTKTYNQARPKDISSDQWVDQINDTIIKMTGLDDEYELEEEEEEAAAAAVPTPAAPPNLTRVATQSSMPPAGPTHAPDSAAPPSARAATALRPTGSAVPASSSSAAAAAAAAAVLGGSASTPPASARPPTKQTPPPPASAQPQPATQLPATPTRTPVAQPPSSAPVAAAQLPTSAGMRSPAAKPPTPVRTPAAQPPSTDAAPTPGAGVPGPATQ